MDLLAMTNERLVALSCGLDKQKACLPRDSEQAEEIDARIYDIGMVLSSRGIPLEEEKELKTQFNAAQAA